MPRGGGRRGGSGSGTRGASTRGLLSRLTTPAPPGPGRLELNVSAEAEREAGGTVYDAPRLDADLGVRARLLLKLEVPWRVATAAAQPAMSGVGNIGFGIKWRWGGGGPSRPSDPPCRVAPC